MWGFHAASHNSRAKSTVFLLMLIINTSVNAGFPLIVDYVVR